ncbi:MAG: aminoacyl-tRNA deacylase [Candidatus Aenigmatarchaeota archaeon]
MSKEDLERYMKEEDIDGEFVEMDGEVKTVRDSAKYLDEPMTKIAKSIVFVVGDERVLVFLSGNKEVDEEKLREVMDAESCRIAKPPEVKEATGYEVGEVPPVGTGLKVILDEYVMQMDEVYVGGGSRYHLVRMTPDEIEDNTDSQVEDISRS